MKTTMPPRPGANRPSPPSPAERRRAGRLRAKLAARYPDAHCALNWTKPHELLVATILSAQCTDVAVNKATPALFKRFPAPADYANATPAAIEPFIRSLGCFRAKSKSLHLSMKEVVERFGGEVPRTMADLVTLRGVARKTANVVLGNAFGINEGFVVDTHIERLGIRFGLVPAGSKVAAIEQRLMSLFPRERWCDISHMIIAHGRGPCKARGKSCADDPICQEFGRCCDRRGAKPSGR